MHPQAKDCWPTPKAGKRHRTGSSSELLEGTSPANQQLGFRALGSTTLKELVPLGSAAPFVLLCCGSSRKPTHFERVVLLQCCFSI